MDYRKKILVLTMALGLGMAGNVHANAYAVAIDDIFDFQMIISDGELLTYEGVSETSATHEGFPGDAHSDPIDALQSTASVGPFPPENTFTPVGRVGDYDRGDAQIYAINPTPSGFNGAARNIAESFDSGPFGLGTGFGGNSLTGEIELFADDSFISFDFLATPYMQVEVTPKQVGGFAEAELSFSITIQRESDGAEVFNWAPVTDGDGVNGDSNGSLNLGIVAHAGEQLFHNDIDGDPDTFDPGMFAYATRTDLLDPGLYNINIAMTERVAQKGVVPEPASLLLFGAGLTGLGFVRRRRSQDK